MMSRFGLLVQGLGFNLITFCAPVAAIDMLTFNPQITINKDSSGGGGLEILAGQSNFYANYYSSLDTFGPLVIPFVVRTTDGISRDYTIKLQNSQHYCQVKDEQAEPLFGVGVSLDGTLLPLPDESGHLGFPVFDKKESKHSMRVTFPIIRVVGDEKSCYGTLVLIAEAES